VRTASPLLHAELIFSAMQDQWYRYGMGFLLVYSITDRRSFEAVETFHKGILRTKDRESVPCVIASNKV
jgi:GTPase SAR1 family protein